MSSNVGTRPEVHVEPDAVTRSQGVFTIGIQRGGNVSEAECAGHLGESVFDRMPLRELANVIQSQWNNELEAVSSQLSPGKDNSFPWT